MCGITGTIFTKELNLSSRVDPYTTLASLTDSKNVVSDKKSGEYRLSHHVDLKTGYYKGRQVFEPKE